MAPGYYDAVLAACRAAGFEPQVAEEAAGSTVWGDIADAKGFGIVVGSLRHQLPAGLTLVDLEPPAPTLTIDLIWSGGDQVPGVRPMLETAERTAGERQWL
jgi:hypothetical protein